MSDVSELKLSGDALIAQKRAEIAAKLAAMRKPPAAAAAPVPTAVPTPSSSSVAAPKPLATPSATEDLARKVAEAKRRVADAQSKVAVKDNPYLVCPSHLSFNFLWFI